jgi:hypothetical protein
MCCAGAQVDENPERLGTKVPTKGVELKREDRPLVPTGGNVLCQVVRQGDLKAERYHTCEMQRV